MTPPPGCRWVLFSTHTWLAIVSPLIGTGPTDVTYEVAANPTGSARMGEVRLAVPPPLPVFVMRVDQEGATTACSPSLAVPAGRFSPSGGPGLVTIDVAAGCAWKAASGVNWISLTGATSGTGPGTVPFSVAAATTSYDRTGWLSFGGRNAVITQVGLEGDFDEDSLPTAWELRFGLDPNSSTGDNGASGDPDGDGLSNQQELEQGTHPRGFVKRYLAEGAISDFFDVSIALLNPSAATVANVLVRFQKADGTEARHYVAVPPLGRRTVNPKQVPEVGSTAFSTLIETDELVVADRTMSWDSRGYGAHAETATVAPATTWYLAEGATHSGFNLFYLIQNPNPTAASVTVTYLLPAGSPVQKTYSVSPQSRVNIWVNNEAATFPVLAATDVSARLESDQPIIVERAMYLDSGGLTFGAGHDSAGVTSPAERWFLAEGATGNFFDLFVLVANPNAATAQIRVEFLLTTGTVVTRNYSVGGNSRFNIWVDTVDPALADAAVSTLVTVTNSVPVIVEEAMWWPGPSASTWYEAHNSPGVTVTGTKWALAEGEQGGTRNVQTYVLIANTSSFEASVQVTLAFEDGTTATATFVIPATSRFNVDVGAYFKASAGRRFGAIVESHGGTPAQIAVQRAMYWDAEGVVWAAGTNALATKLR